MNAAIPQPDSIPAAPWIFHGLETALFFVHILLVDAVLGMCLAAFVLRLARRREDAAPLVLGASRATPVLMAWTVTAGVAPLLFLQVLYGHFFYTSSILMAFYFILVIPLIIAAYYALYARKRSSAAFSPLAVAETAAATAILLYIAFALSANVSLMLSPESWKAYASNRSGTILPLGQRAFFPRYLHFVIGAVAIGGLSLAIVDRARRGARSAAEPATAPRSEAGRLGLKIFAWATIAESAGGFWFLASLPGDFPRRFMGGEAYPTIVLAAGIALGLAAMVLSFMGRLLPTLVLAPASILSMVLARDALRSMYLSPYFVESSLVVKPQYGVLALFLAVLAAGIAIVLYMVRAGFRPTGGKA
jgi:hypothetical protein